MTHAQRSALFLLVAISAVATAAAPADAQAPITWDPIVEIAAGGGQRGPWRQNDSNYDYVDDPSAALDARGAAAVAWVDQRRKDVFYQVYERDGTPRLKQPVNVSRSPHVFSWLPRVVLSPSHPGDVFILWQEIVFSGGSHGGDIFFARSSDGGASFSTPMNLSSSIGGDGKGRINKDIWHNGSLDLAIGRNGALYAAWTEYDGPLWFSRSQNRGESFSKPMLLAGSGNASPARAPALAVGPDDTLYLAWTIGEDKTADIRIATSTDGGVSFSAPKIVAQTRGYSDAPKLAVDRNGTVHLVYGESSGGPFERYHVRYTRSRDRARTFEPARDISKPLPQGIQSAAFPALDLDEQDNVYVLWELFPDSRAHPRGLAIAYSRDRGETFERPSVVPGSSDPAGASNGSHQGLLMRKLAVNGAGSIAVVNSSLKAGGKSRVWLMRGRVPARR